MPVSVQLALVRGVSLGPFVLGASIHDVLGRIKSAPTSFPVWKFVFFPGTPVIGTFAIQLPLNGLRLSFDGPEQRLRLIEVLDFSKSTITYDGSEITKAREGNRSLDSSSSSDGSTDKLKLKSGPSFQAVRESFGAAKQGEYNQSQGLYVLSYPGVSFTFPIQPSRWRPNENFLKTVDLLSSADTGPTACLAVYAGQSWPAARNNLYSAPISRSIQRAPALPGIRKENIPREIEVARIYDQGRIELVRNDSSSFMLVLGETVPQDIIAELGPPDRIYEKPFQNSRKASAAAHNTRRHSSTSAARATLERHSGRLAESDPPSRAISSSDSEDEDEGTETSSLPYCQSDVFYCYYSQGFDILVGIPKTTTYPSRPTFSTSTQPSTSNTAANPDLSLTLSPSFNEQQDISSPTSSHPPFVLPRSHLTATKLVVHGNVPGSYQFTQYRRLRWEIVSDCESSLARLQHTSTVPSLPALAKQNEEISHPQRPLTSENLFKDISHQLQKVFRNHYASEKEARDAWAPQSINRAWERNRTASVLARATRSSLDGAMPTGIEDWGVIGRVSQSKQPEKERESTKAKAEKAKEDKKGPVLVGVYAKEDRAAIGSNSKVKNPKSKIADENLAQALAAMVRITKLAKPAAGPGGVLTLNSDGSLKKQPKEVASENGTGEDSASGSGDQSGTENLGSGDSTTTATTATTATSAADNGEYARGIVENIGSVAIYVFPGLAFEVLMNGAVAGLTVF